MGKDIELAILFADVVGSTRLYEHLGDLRARDMVSICIDVMCSATEQRRGTVIKTMGDEVMATFPSADEALNAAAALSAKAAPAIASSSVPCRRVSCAVTARPCSVSRAIEEPSNRIEGASWRL